MLVSSLQQGQEGYRASWEVCLMGEGTENGQGRTTMTNQIVMCGDVSLTSSLSESAVSLRLSLPWPAWLVAQEALDLLLSGSLKRGSAVKRGPSPHWVCWWANCCSSSALVPTPGIFLAQCPRGSANLLTYSNWLLLAAPTHKCCFRIKELGTIETGSGPADTSARPGQASENSW